MLSAQRLNDEPRAFCGGSIVLFGGTPKLAEDDAGQPEPNSGTSYHQA